MKRLIAWSLLALAALVVVACSNGFSAGGSKPDAPTNVSVTPGDSSVVVSWDMKDGIEYWIFVAQASSISTDNWTTLPEARVLRNAVSPQIVPGLTNGKVYSFTVNGRKDSGPGGSGSPSISTIPRVAGLTWNAGTPLATSSLNGLHFLGLTIPGVFTAVGNGGVIFQSSDAVSWTPVTSGVTTDLNAVTYGQGRFIVVGKGGLVLSSTDNVTYTSGTSGTTNDLLSIGVGLNGIVAVGANGTIVHSTDGSSWTVAASGTTKTLYAVTYSNTAWYAVGAGGTLLTSPDGDIWTALASGTTADLHGYTWNGTTYVAVGSGGTDISSTDATTWTAVTRVTTSNLSSVTAGSQFVAVGAGGTIISSIDATNWSVVSSPTTADLNAVLFGLTGFSAVGVGGVNLTSF
jgi:hypothetical protein